MMVYIAREEDMKDYWKLARDMIGDGEVGAEPEKPEPATDQQVEGTKEGMV